MQKQAHPKASVIVSVYNRLDFLCFVLAGLEVQTQKDFEVIVSDDGSGSEFVEGLKQIIESSPLRIRHVWHEDEGFRKNKILNESIRCSSADYLIFIDGDCIPHPAFVEEHLREARPGVCLAGRRVDLSERITRSLSPARIRQGMLQRPSVVLGMFSDYLRGRLGHFMNGFYARNAFLRRFFNRKERGLLGANFSLHKADMLAINGFDERYTHPTYGEDSDVELRLRLSGIRLKPVLNIAVMYHCHHKLLPRPQESRAVYEMALAEQRPYTPYGINPTTEKKQ